MRSPAFGTWWGQVAAERIGADSRRVLDDRSKVIDGSHRAVAVTNV
jgi:hypothetical protein